jgi:hypothetical protein
MKRVWHGTRPAQPIHDGLAIEHLSERPSRGGDHGGWWAGKIVSSTTSSTVKPAIRRVLATKEMMDSCFRLYMWW